MASSSLLDIVAMWNDEGGGWNDNMARCGVSNVWGVSGRRHPVFCEHCVLFGVEWVSNFSV